MTKAFDQPDNALLDSLADGLRSLELAADQRSSMRERIMRRVTSQAPANTRTVRRDEGEWVKVGELVMIKTLRFDRVTNTQTVLIRMLPGGMVVGHRHSAEEECFIIEGEVEIGEHHLFQGDVHFAGPGSVHPPLTTRTGALVMIRSEIPPEHFAIAPR